MADGLLKRSFMGAAEWLDRRYGWHRLPKFVALVTLSGLRMKLRRENLYDVTGERLPWAPAPLPPGPRPLTRSIDGSGNDRTQESMGEVGAAFGRNVPLDDTVPVRRAHAEPTHGQPRADDPRGVPSRRRP